MSKDGSRLTGRKTEEERLKKIYGEYERKERWRETKKNKEEQRKIKKEEERS